MSIAQNEKILYGDLPTVNGEVHLTSCMATSAELIKDNWEESSLSSSTGYAQTVTVTGMTSDLSVIVTPAPNSLERYTEANVRATTQGTNTLTFYASRIPSASLTANILMIKTT